MQTIISDKIVFCDVDDTLVMWNNDLSFSAIDKKSTAFMCPFQAKRDPLGEPKWYYLRPNYKTIQYLKEYKAKGHTIVIWSAGSYLWAETVVKTLKLEDIVDFCMSKPDVCLDDLPPLEWIREIIYPR